MDRSGCRPFPQLARRWLLGATLAAACAPAARTTSGAAATPRPSTPRPDTLQARVGTRADSAAPADPATGEGPLKHAATPTVPAITPADLMSRLYVFADDSMMGREAGTEGNVKGTAYLAAEVRRIGLEPAGDSGSYFQDVPMVSSTADSASALEVAGDRLALGRDFLPLPLLPSIFPFGPSFDATAAPAVYAGRAGDSVSVGFVARSAGKLVVLAPPLGPDGTPSWQFFRGPIPNFPDAAAVAVATLDISPPEAIAFFGQPQLRVAAAPAASRKAPLGMIITSAAAARLFGAPVGGLKPGATGKPVRGHVGFTEAAPAAPARNVIGILRGSDPVLRGEYVALGAHNDHIGVRPPAVDHDSLRSYNAVVRREGANGPPAEPAATQFAEIRRGLDSLRRLRPPRADSIANGADDDGSGSVTLLEIAEALAKGSARPQRSILFVWHTAEEKGLYGSQWFTEHPTVARDSIVAQLNLDMVGRGSAMDVEGGGPYALGLVGSRRLSTELGDLIERVNRERGHHMRLDYRYDADGHPDNVYCRSDHYMYARQGIPIAFFSTGLHRDYHQVTDEPQYIDYAHMARVAAFVRDVALAVAGLDHRLVVDHPKPDPDAPCRQ